MISVIIPKADAKLVLKGAAIYSAVKDKKEQRTVWTGQGSIPWTKVSPPTWSEFKLVKDWKEGFFTITYGIKEV